MSHITPEELELSLRRVKKYIDDNKGSGSGDGGGNNSGGTSITVDSNLSSTSTNPVQNKVLKAALDSKANADDIPDVSNLATKNEIPDMSGFATTTAMNAALAGKQDVLTFDAVPTENSINPVTSGGIYSALQNVGGGSGTGDYILPKASESVLGGIRIGAGLGIDSNGILYVVGAPKSEGRLVLSESVVELDPVTRSATVQILDSTGDISIESSNDDVVVTQVGATISVVGKSADDIGSVIVTSAENGLYTVASATFYVGVPIVTWSDGSDAAIKAMLDAHYKDKLDIHDYWNVGDERTVRLSAMSNMIDGVTIIEETHVEQDVVLTLVNAGGRQLSDGSGECAFVWEQKDVLKTATGTVAVGRMHITTSVSTGWGGCDRRKWCNGIYYNAFSSIFKGIIKQSDVTYNEISNNMFIKSQCSDYCFLPALSEHYAYKETDTQYVGSKFELILAKSGYHWSRYLTTTTNFQWLNSYSMGGGGSQATNNQGIAPCGCI